MESVTIIFSRFRLLSVEILGNVLGVVFWKKIPKIFIEVCQSPQWPSVPIWVCQCLHRCGLNSENWESEFHSCRQFRLDGGNNCNNRHTSANDMALVHYLKTERACYHLTFSLWYCTSLVFACHYQSHFSLISTEEGHIFVSLPIYSSKNTTPFKNLPTDVAFWTIWDYSFSLGRI